MNKLKLQLDDLRVDSFDTTAVEGQKGTVLGEQCTCWTRCGQNTCPGCPTCDASCNSGCQTCVSCEGTCDSCNGTCVTCEASCYGSCGDTCWFTCAVSCQGSCGPDTCYLSCYNGMSCYGALC
jgi:hypothetical protein